jgi:hypothetical protein
MVQRARVLRFGDESVRRRAPSNEKIIISHSKMAWLIFPSSQRPAKTPPITPGASQRFIVRLAELIKPREALKGTLRRLIAKKNQAAVPTNSNLGSRHARR